MTIYLINHFAVLTFNLEAVKHGFILTATTDRTCHLWFRYTLIEPKTHLKTRIRRGYPLKQTTYICFDVYTDVEQNEPGDTITHTFNLLDWPYCQKRWWYFWATIASIKSPSESAIFHYHRIHKEYQGRPEHSLEDCQRGLYRGKDYFGTGYGYIAAGWYDAYYKNLGGGMYFLELPIEPGSIIINAYLTFQCYTTGDGPGVKTKIRAQLDPYPYEFSTMKDYDTRPRTISYYEWDNIEPWLPPNIYRSPNFYYVIQEIINLTWWQKDNPIVIFWDDHEGRSLGVGIDARWAQSYDSIPTAAPELTVLWLPPPPRPL